MPMNTEEPAQINSYTSPHTEVAATTPISRTRQTLHHLLSGLAMGAADAVPGVSGGTVALVMGVYRRLVTAISQVSLEALGELRQGDWRGLAERFDLRFLVTLAIGIAIGLLTFVMLLHELIGTPDAPAATRPYVYALFFGAICGSSYLVAKLTKPTSPGQAALYGLLGAAGAGFAFWLTGLDQLTPISTAPNLLFAFLLGAVAISAMILPGISGSYLLLIFGAYSYFSGIPKAILKGQLVTQDVLDLADYAVLCLEGLLSYAKELRWLLIRHEGPTMTMM
jgi:putative membrane protein